MYDCLGEFSKEDFSILRECYCVDDEIFFLVFYLGFVVVEELNILGIACSVEVEKIVLIHEFVSIFLMDISIGKIDRCGELDEHIRGSRTDGVLYDGLPVEEFFDLGFIRSRFDIESVSFVRNDDDIMI